MTATPKPRAGRRTMQVRLKRQFTAHHGIFIASPEYNASITPLLKNTLDWISRVREAGEPPPPFSERVFALGAASNGTYGGYRSLIALRHVLELGCGALVLPDQVAIRNAATAFDEAGQSARRRRCANGCAACLPDWSMSRTNTRCRDSLIARAPRCPHRATG